MQSAFIYMMKLLLLRPGAQGPFTYEALPPEDIKFVPLKQTQEFRANDLMQVRVCLYLCLCVCVGANSSSCTSRSIPSSPHSHSDILLPWHIVWHMPFSC